MFNSLSNLCRNIGFKAKQHAPEIMTIGGVVGWVAAAGLACYATVKATEDVGEAKAEITAIEETKAKSDTYTEEDYKKDKNRVYWQLTGKLARRYALPVGLGALSTAGILSGAKIRHSRYLTAAASSASLAATVKDIRDGLIEKFGEEEGKKLYNEIRYGLTEVEDKEQIEDENGKKRTCRKKMLMAGSKDVRDISYVRRFDWHNPYWSEDQTYNLFFVRAIQNWANDKLRADGRIFMNDEDKALGFPTTKAGQIVGNRYDLNDPHIDNFVDFNIQEAWDFDENGVRRPIILIEYNVDGSILDKVDWDA